MSQSDNSPFLFSFDQGTLLLKDKSKSMVESLFGKEIWTWDRRVSIWRCEAFHYRQVLTTLHKNGLSWRDDARGWTDVSWGRQDIHAPRPEQQDAIDAWLGTVATAETDCDAGSAAGKRGVVVMPTGTGKTEVALHLMAQTACSTLIIAPVRDLMYQWHRRVLKGLSYDAGIIGDNTFNVKPVSVTTYDSASIHGPTLGDRFKLLIFDECHHLPGNFRRDSATMSIAPWRLGLTATPERSDGRQNDLKDLIGPRAFTLGIERVKGKTLADFDIVRIPVHLNDAEQMRYNECSDQVRSFMYEKRQTVPDFQWPDLCSESATDPYARQALVAFRHKQAIEDRATEKLRVLEDLFRLHAGTPMIVFAGSNAMARDVSMRFLIPCLLSHCGKKERLDILGGLADGGYPAIVANQVLDEGVDVPAVKIAIVIGGSSSTRQAKQRLGRILRRTGNARATLYEVVCQDTGESRRSAKRRKSDAYARTRHRRI